jgi:hypothetical protein
MAEQKTGWRPVNSRDKCIAELDKAILMTRAAAQRLSNKLVRVLAEANYEGVPTMERAYVTAERMQAACESVIVIGQAYNIESALIRNVKTMKARAGK